MDRARRLRLLPWLAVGACLVASSSVVIGMDRYKFMPLPHLGYGGEARSFSANNTQTTVGQVRDAQGNTHACLWSSSNGWALQLLPDLGGSNSVANGGVSIEDGAGHHTHVFVGAAETPAGVMKPVLWTEESDGSFTRHVLPTMGGPAGVLSATAACNGGGACVVGSSQITNGDVEATFWRQTPGGFQAVNLGTLGGRNSQALDIVIDFASAGIVIAGSAQTASGLWHAALWRSMDDGMTWTIEDRHPGGAMSTFAGTSEHGGCVDAAGTAQSANGRSMGISFNDCAGPFGLLAPGFGNTAAQDVLSTPYGSRAVGSAWNDVATPQGVVWNSVRSLARTQAYLLSGPLGNYGADIFAGMNGSVNAIGPGAIVGSFLDTSAGTGMQSPLALIADGAELPDLVDVTAGVPELRFSETDLWHANDGHTLRIRSQNQNGDAVSFDARFFLKSVQGFRVEIAGLDIRARIAGSPGATAQAEVQVYNFQTNTWDTAGVLPCYTYWNDASMLLRGITLETDTGEIWVRVNLSRLSGNIRGYEIDSVILTPMP